MSEYNTDKLEETIRIIEEQISEQNNAYLDETVKQAQDRPDLFYKYMLFTVFQMSEQLEVIISTVTDDGQDSENTTH